MCAGVCAWVFVWFVGACVMRMVCILGVVCMLCVSYRRLCVACCVSRVAFCSVYVRCVA